MVDEVKDVKATQIGEVKPEAAPVVEPKSASLVTFMPLQSFDGYPDGINIVHFIEGEVSAPVTPEYLQLLKSKNLVAD